jgi:hypothetical protein
MRVVLWVPLALLIGACGPKTMEARMRDAERASERGSGYLDEAEKAAAALEPRKMQSALEDAREQLTRPDAPLHPETSMHLDRLRELEAKLPLVKAEREKRDLEVRLNKAREKVVPRVQAMLEVQETLDPAAPALRQLERLEDAAKAVKDAVEDEQDLFAKDADFAMWARSQRNKVDRALEAAARARRALAFNEGPAVAWRDALALQQQAKEKKAVADQHAALEQARAKLASCARGAKPFDEEKATSSTSFAVAGGKLMTPGQLAAACTRALKEGDAEFRKVTAALEAGRAKEKKQKAAADAKARK